MPRRPSVLVSWYTTPEYIPPPHLADNQTTIGPTFERKYPDTKGYDYYTPSGQYDLAQTLRDTGASVDYDLIVVFADASCTNLPRNLASLKGRKLLLVGDTHHLSTPLQSMIQYVRSEPYEFIVSSYNRQHLHWFTEAGCPNVAWIPGACARHISRPLSPQRKIQVAFVGRLGRFHKRRTRLIDFLKRMDVPLLAGIATPTAAATHYSKSTISFNCSLNGDLNLRVFEILSAGGFLMTDRLAPESGMDLLFREDVEVVYYDTQEELLDKVIYYFKHPDVAAAIARRGHQRFLKEHLPITKATALLDWVFNDRLDPLYAITNERREEHAGGHENFNQRLRVYEAVQALHEHNESVSVLFDSHVSHDFMNDLRDLPRVDVSVLAMADDVTSAGQDVQSADGVQLVTGQVALSHSWDLVVWRRRNSHRFLQRKIRTSGVIYVSTDA